MSQTETVTQPVLSRNFEFYAVRFKLETEFLATCSEVAIYQKHVIEKAKKNIRQANSLTGKMTKELKNYVGAEITEQKEYRDLVGILRTYMALLGKVVDIPLTVEGVVKLAEELGAEFDDMVKNNGDQKATVFMRDHSGFPIISTHMVLGNMKEIIKTIVNNGDKGESTFKSKTSVNECLALDVKAIEQYMTPSHDIVRDENGKRVLLERPIRFDNMGKQTTAIALSEQLPIGTTFGCTLRIRAASNLNSIPFLCKIFGFGINLGFGAWRGSGNKGSYRFKLEHLPDFVEDIEDGWM